jgi:zinc transport system permease protein
MAALDLLLVLLVWLFYKELVALSFDSVYAATRNVPVEKLYLLLVAATALTVVMVMQVVGLIMVIALLTLPAAIAGQYGRDLRQMMVVASALGILFCGAGLALSYGFNLSSGAAIILVAGGGYLLSLVGNQAFKMLKGFGNN